MGIVILNFEFPKGVNSACSAPLWLNKLLLNHRGTEYAEKNMDFIAITKILSST
jgi:hypothetical protein